MPEYKSFNGNFSNGQKGVASFSKTVGLWKLVFFYNGNVSGLNENFSYSVYLDQGQGTNFTIRTISAAGFNLQDFIANYFDAILINLPVSLSTKCTSDILILGTPEEYIQENNYYIEILDINNNLVERFTFDQQDQQTGNSNSGLSHIRGHVFIGILIILLICLYIYKYKFNGRITFPKYSTHIPSF
jgi:hypothetical protein